MAVQGAKPPAPLRPGTPPFRVRRGTGRVVTSPEAEETVPRPGTARLPPGGAPRLVRPPTGPGRRPYGRGRPPCLGRKGAGRPGTPPGPRPSLVAAAFPDHDILDRTVAAIGAYGSGPLAGAVARPVEGPPGVRAPVVVAAAPVTPVVVAASALVVPDLVATGVAPAPWETLSPRPAAEVAARAVGPIADAVARPVNVADTTPITSAAMVVATVGATCRPGTVATVRAEGTAATSGGAATCRLTVAVVGEPRPVEVACRP